MAIATAGGIPAPEAGHDTRVLAAVDSTGAEVDPPEAGRTGARVGSTAPATGIGRPTTPVGADGRGGNKRSSTRRSAAHPDEGLATLTEWMPGNENGSSVQVLPAFGLTNSCPVVVPT